MSEFKEKVTELVGKMEQADDGKWALPEDLSKDLDEPTLFAVTAERRYRDTQGAYTKAQQESKRNKAIADGLQDHIMNSDAKLTTEQKRELNTLKGTDPEAWRTKLNEYETAAKTIQKTELEEIATNAGNKSELEVRSEQMAAWSESTGLTLNDDVIKNDLPPRFMSQLKAGEITFEDFLVSAGEFLKAEKTIKGADEGTGDNEPNLADAAGGSEPSKQAQEGDFDDSYSKAMF